MHRSDHPRSPFAADAAGSCIDGSRARVRDITELARHPRHPRQATPGSGRIPPDEIKREGCHKQGVPIDTFKCHVTGNGTAEKAAAIAAVQARGFLPADDNDSAVLAILLWATETQGGVR